MFFFQARVVQTYQDMLKAMNVLVVDLENYRDRGQLDDQFLRSVHVLRRTLNDSCARVSMVLLYTVHRSYSYSAWFDIFLCNERDVEQSMTSRSSVYVVVEEIELWSPSRSVGEDIVAVAARVMGLRPS
jgi:hypothetical protein